MYDLRETQREWYKQRLGAVYGDYRVVDIEYDEKLHKQKWTMQCIRCGDTRVTYNHHDYVKGKNPGKCKFCSRMMKIRSQPPKRDWKAEKLAEMSKYIGREYGSWEILDAKIGMGFLVECTICGKQKWQSWSDVFNHTSERCTCNNGERKYLMKDWKGKKFGHLTICGYDKKCFICKCDCGNTIMIRPHHLIRGSQVCCGIKCRYHQEEIKTLDGESKTRLYRIWRGMHERCYNEESRGYRWYGRRGIVICDEWRENFFEFKKWALEHGYKDDLTIDRIDSDGNYEPSNCRWATYKEQAENKRPPFTLTEKDKSMLTLYFIDGVGKTKEEWYKIYDTSGAAVDYRRKKWGMTFEEALKTPKKKTGRPRKEQ